MMTTLFYHTYFFNVGLCTRFLQISPEPPPRRGWATPGALGIDTRRDTDVAVLYSWLPQRASGQCQSTVFTAVGPTRRPKKSGTVGKTAGGRSTAIHP
jgi:hypothetical protein